MPKPLLLMIGPVVFLALAACAAPGTGPTPEPRPGEAGDGPLAYSLQVRPANGTVSFTLAATNRSTVPVTLTFPSGQSFDFAVMQGSQELWRWSADRMFTQAIREESLAPGETRTYEAQWTPPAGLRGTLLARGWLTAREHRAEQSTYFTLP